MSFMVRYGAKHLVFLIWQVHVLVYKIVMGSSDCPPNKKMHCQNTNKNVCMEMVLAESAMLVGCSYLAKQ